MAPLERLSRVRRPLVLAVLTLAIGLPLAIADPASACSCGPLGDEGSLAAADAVFSGELVVQGAPANSTLSNEEATMSTFVVTRVFKGQVGAEARIVSYGTCDLGVQAPVAALVFAQRDPRVYGELVLVSSYCQGTRRLGESPVPVSFGAGVPPGPLATDRLLPPSFPGRQSPRGRTWLVVGGAATVAAVVLVSGGRLFLRHRRIGR